MRLIVIPFRKKPIALSRYYHFLNKRGNFKIGTFLFFIKFFYSFLQNNHSCGLLTSIKKIFCWACRPLVFNLMCWELSFIYQGISSFSFSFESTWLKRISSFNLIKIKLGVGGTPYQFATVVSCYTWLCSSFLYCIRNRGSEI